MTPWLAMLSAGPERRPQNLVKLCTLSLVAPALAFANSSERRGLSRFVVVAVRRLIVEKRGLEEVPSVSRPRVLVLPRQRLALRRLLLLLRVRVAEERMLSVAERHRSGGGIL